MSKFKTPSEQHRTTQEVVGVRFDRVTVRGFCEEVMSKSVKYETNQSHYHFLNAYSLVLASKDPALLDLLSQSNSVNLPDGKPVVWVSALSSSHPLRQVRGPYAFETCFDVGRKYGVKHYLLGSTEDVLSRLSTELIKKYPGVQIVGSYSPPFRQLTETELHAQDRDIRESGAHVVWVGLGTPKQDYEVARLAERVDAVPLAVGAAFDFSAGSLERAPEWMARIGLEWLFRLMAEPKRLWRRYLIGNPQFVWMSIRWLCVGLRSSNRRAKSEQHGDGGLW